MRAGGRNNVRTQDQLVTLDIQHSRAIRNSLPLLDGRRDYASHPNVALQRNHFGDIVRRRDEAGHQLAGGHHHDAGFAKRWQHFLDIAQESLVRSDQQHAAPGQPLAVRVQKVRGTM